jgi:hypothetical protein
MAVCFKTIKKQGCSEVATYLFCFVINYSVDWDYASRRMNPYGGMLQNN